MRTSDKGDFSLFGYAMQLVGSWISEQGLNLGPWQ